MLWFIVLSSESRIVMYFLHLIKEASQDGLFPDGEHQKWSYFHCIVMTDFHINVCCWLFVGVAIRYEVIKETCAIPIFEVPMELHNFSAYFVTSTLRGILFLSSTSWSFILGDGACREITTKRPVSQRSQYRITTKENCHNITLHSFHFHHLYICTYFYMLLQTCIRHKSKAASRSNNPVKIKQGRNGRIRCDCMDRNDNKVEMRAGQDEKSYKKKRVRKVTKSAR